jgi:hypothetical protein
VVDQSVKDWRRDQRHLPTWMRDFHDQKQLFKAVYDQSPSRGVEPGPHEGIDWASGHVYTIDSFLWFMARHGYVLSKSPAKLPFDNIHDTLEADGRSRAATTAAIINSAMTKP